MKQALYILEYPRHQIIQEDLEKLVTEILVVIGKEETLEQWIFL